MTRPLESRRLGATLDLSNVALTADPFDVSKLLNRCLGNVAFAERLLAKFQDRFPNDIDSLEQASHAGDSAAVAQVAHRLKGAAGAVAADRLWHVCASIEDLGRQEQLRAVPPQLERLRLEWTEFLHQSLSLPHTAGVSFSDT